MFAALPHGCVHIEWTWGETAATDLPDGHPDRDLHRPAGEHYATWIREPGPAETSERFVREQEIAAQGLRMVGAPHLCQTDPDTGRELWAVQLAHAE